MNKDIVEYINGITDFDNLSDSEIITLFNKVKRLPIDKLAMLKEKYNKLWLLHAQIDPEGQWSEKDKIHYPSFGWASGEFKGLGFIRDVSDALRKLKGVSNVSNGTLYESGGWRGRIIWNVTFDNIRVFNHFLWASCFRFMPIEKNDKWEIYCDIGDPNYDEKKLRMYLAYVDKKSEREEWEKDVIYMAKCINSYAESEWNKDKDFNE